MPTSLCMEGTTAATEAFGPWTYRKTTSHSWRGYSYAAESVFPNISKLQKVASYEKRSQGAMTSV
jgi:hypothetical protein